MTGNARQDGHARVLVVEDDPAVIEFVVDVLETIGLVVASATSDAAAYDALRRFGRFSALVVDINLGRGTTGYDVARRARQTQPRVPVVYVSGQAPPGSLHAFGVPGAVFLEKPFSAGELLTSVKAVLGELPED